MKKSGTGTGINLLSRSDLNRILFVLLGTISYACGNNSVTDYYDTGEVKSIHELKDGDYYGSFSEYFKNGVLEREGQFVNGKLNGTIQTFFESGKKRSVMEYDQGKLNGPSIGYFESGNINYETEFLRGTRVGWTVNFFDSDEKIVKERKLYNTDGKLIYLKTFDKDEIVIINQITPYLEFEDDTVNYNEFVNLEVHVGLKIPKTIVYFGLSGQKLGLQDTLAVDTIGEDKMFTKFRSRINKLGRVKVGCIFLNSSADNDSTKLENISPSHWIFVRKEGLESE